MKRLPAIEGLRAYLALWVVMGHILAAGHFEGNQGNDLLRTLRQGWLAVDVFVIVSGFVIFYLLDQKREAYTRFITRRFFRLWPLFIILFAIGIPISLLRVANLNELSALHPSAFATSHETVAQIQSWWDHIVLHIALRLPMLHGLVPEMWLSDAPSAFLGPAWSISLEWQFYLVAPLVFRLSQAANKIGAAMVCGLSWGLFHLGRSLPEIQNGAFLPMHVEFFFLGGLSYFLFRKLSHRERRLPLLPFAIMMAPLILFASGMAAESLPYIIWVGFFALLLDLQQKKVGAVIRAAAWLFENRLVCHLGKLSYSIYLSHFLVITLCQFALVQLLPALPHHQHVLLLGLLVLCATVGISQMLHRLIELPGMRLGRRLADSMDQKPAEKALPG